jgi:photosystem I subunit 9
VGERIKQNEDKEGVASLPKGSSACLLYRPKENVFCHKFTLVVYRFLFLLIHSTIYHILMKDFTTYLSTAPVVATAWFAFTAGLLIEINRFFPDPLVFAF